MPERVPIMRPSSGVKPMVDIVALPPRTAASEALLPRWQVIMRRDCKSLPRISAARRDVYCG